MRGLEALHVQWHVPETARSTGLSEVQVRTLLHALVDAETLKTIPKSTDDLKQTVVAADTAGADRLGRAVEEALDPESPRDAVRLSHS